MRNKFLCVHGHFYQPPRENPWLGELEPEPSASPYRDWNSRIFAECYGPNAACPVRDDDGRIVAMADNYRQISFNFGATLLSWLERERPLFYRHLLEADRESVAARGHGNAIAQPYYHAILPLATRRDKTTLVRWGIQDFEARFGRRPEGMFVPETAVDEETLQVLAEEGIRFTILQQDQVAASKVPSRGAGEEWREHEAGPSPRGAYRWNGENGRALALFLFDRGLKDMVVDGSAFGGPVTLFDKALGKFAPGDAAELVLIASDGEFYGHHHRLGHAFLARTLAMAEAAGVRVLSPAEFLDLFPPPLEARLRPKTSWSCPHGIARWMEDCGCRSKHLPDWRQGWRGPLREALYWLAGEIDAVYARHGGELFADFWSARDDYGLLLSGREGPQEFVAARARRAPSSDEVGLALRLLEMERQRLAMFTSCGWFYDDVSGLETQQVLRHAARAVELAESFGVALADGLKQRLKAAPSNLKQFEDGAKAYALLAEPSRCGLRRAAARFALLDHFGHGAAVDSPALSVARLDGAGREAAGRAGRRRALSWRRLRLISRETLESAELDAVVYASDRLDVDCWLAPAGGPPPQDLLEAFAAVADDEAMRALLCSRFGSESFGLDALLSDERLQLTRTLLPVPFAARERLDFLRRWSESVAKLRAGQDADDELLEGLEGCRKLQLLPDHLPWTELVRARFRAVVAGLAAGADSAALNLASRWIEAAERARFHVEVWEAQHALWRWREALARREALPGEAEALQALGEKLGFAFAVTPGTPVTDR